MQYEITSPARAQKEQMSSNLDMDTRIHDLLMETIDSVRYVATKNGLDIRSKQRLGLVDSSDSESDQYEERFVNPAILSLTMNRGDLDCGGLSYVLVRYGNFFQYVRPTDFGHISIAIELEANLDETLTKIEQVLTPQLSTGNSEKVDRA